MFIKNLVKVPTCVRCIAMLYRVIRHSAMYLKFQLKSQEVRTIKAVRYLTHRMKEPQAKYTHYIYNKRLYL